MIYFFDFEHVVRALARLLYVFNQDGLSKLANAISKRKISLEQKISSIQEIYLSRLYLIQYSKELKEQKSLALRKSKIIRLEKLAKVCNISLSKIAGKAIREVLELDI